MDRTPEPPLCTLLKELIKREWELRQPGFRFHLRRSHSQTQGERWVPACWGAGGALEADLIPRHRERGGSQRAGGLGERSKQISFPDTGREVGPSVPGGWGSARSRSHSQTQGERWVPACRGAGGALEADLIPRHRERGGSQRAGGLGERSKQISFPDTGREVGPSVPGGWGSARKQISFPDTGREVGPSVPGGWGSARSRSHSQTQGERWVPACRGAGGALEADLIPRHRERGGSQRAGGLGERSEQISFPDTGREVGPSVPGGWGSARSRSHSQTQGERWVPACRGAGGALEADLIPRHRERGGSQRAGGLGERSKQISFPDTGREVGPSVPGGWGSAQVQ
ncbi:collagen alpha-1(IX) chain-like [Polyodon spathula]|uniref:collagen alpha-1(IX) chain-like n=1 Tax=Polyodon spathula TaxID=7913 RepID=UPI001B7EBCE4|nr:collagen alpha-1(IX) chain-like [Polyodon spathula]